MFKRLIIPTRTPNRFAYLWLTVAAALFLFYGGQWAIPLAAWLAPLFLLRFVRTQHPLSGFLLAWLVTSGVRADRILLLTFTRRAARQMLARTQAMHADTRGVRGGTFGAWRLPGGNHATGGNGAKGENEAKDENWETLGAFGNTRPPTSPGSGPSRVPGVLSAAVNGGLLLVTVSDSQRYRLYASADLGRTWTEAAPPAEQQAGSDAASAVATAEGRWLYLADDAKAGRVWTADSSR